MYRKSFVEGGAPDGYSPGSAAKMEGGHFRVPGIDINSQIAKMEDANASILELITDIRLTLAERKND